MRAFGALGRGTRHIGEVFLEGILVAAIIAALALVLSPIYAPAGFLSGANQGVDAKGEMKFSLSVDHPDGTTLNDNEVVYYAKNLQGGIGGNTKYVIRHRCWDGNVVVVDQVKGIWFPSGGKVTGTAYFFALGDECSGVVLDMSDGGGTSTAALRTVPVVSNTVTYGTNPLP